MKRSSIFYLFMLLFSSLTSYAQFHDAILLNQQTTIKVYNTKLIKNHIYSIQINSRAGDKYADIAIPYSSLVQVSKIQAAVTDIAGNPVKKLKPSDIKTRSVISDYSLYEDRMIKEFTLKNNVYPYILTYSYEETESPFLFIDYWRPVLDRSIPTLKASLTINFNPGYQLKYTTNKIKAEKKDTIENGIQISWSADFDGISESEIYAPEADNYFPTVKIVPVNFTFKEKGSMESWKSFGDWQCRVNKSLTELPVEEKAKINSLIDGVNDQKSKLKILYHYLQDATRYINVSVETGGIIPYPASYVAENKYGDCKALSNYFLAVLQYSGIKSHYCIINAGDKISIIDKSFPSQQFNHIILCVPAQNDTTWLDCTSDGPFGYLGTFTQGRDVLITDNTNGHLTRTPKLKTLDVEDFRNIYCIYKDSECSVEFKNRIKGSKFEQLSMLSRDYNAETLQMIIRNGFIENGFELLDYNLLSADRDSTYINLNYRTQTNKLFQKYGNELVIKSVRFDLPKFTKPAERKFPVQIDYPVCKTDSQFFSIPDGYTVTIDRKEEKVESEFGKYMLKASITNQKLLVLKSFVLYDGIYPLTRYPALYNFMKKINDIENNSAYLLNKI